MQPDIAMQPYLVRIGVDFRRAPLAIREHLGMSAAEAAQFLRLLREETPAQGAIIECMVLSTCNRTEIYFVSESGAAAIPAVVRCLKTFRPAQGPLYEKCELYQAEGDEAVAQLFRVTAGLESQILGDSQILSQVRKAWDVAREAGMGGRVLECTVRSAIHAGKCVRAEAQLSAGGAGVGAAVLRSIRKRVADPYAAHILVLGAGEAAAAVVSHLVKLQPRALTICARQLAAADDLVKDSSYGHGFRARSAEWGDVLHQAGRADVIIAAASAKLDALSVQRLGDARSKAAATLGHRPLLVLDLGVPRNADAAIAGLPDVTLLDVDALDQEQSAALDRRMRQLPVAEQILAREMDRWRSRMLWLMVEPSVKQWYAEADQIQQELVAEMAATADVQALMEQLAGRLTKKLLDRPVRGLRKAILRPGSSAAAEVAGAWMELSGSDFR
ncbi:MAG: glutamyl-tRNA reductase [Bryobacterales bacterium]|nr:glutamyl-tRNA reductase [Bryobacterales bacterium]